jgi:hypothetical protein
VDRAAALQRGHETLLTVAVVLPLIQRVSDTLAEIPKKDAVR